jgi:hypothetical protein
MSVISYITLETSSGKFQLRDLIPSKGVTLVFLGRKGGVLESWSEDIEYLLRSLDTDTHTHRYMELMITCDHFGWNFEEVCKELVELYKEALKHNIFKNE